MDNLAERLRKIRGQIGKAEFANSLDVHPNTYGNYEKGSRCPDGEFLARVCNIYRVNPAWLLIGSGSMTVDVLQGGTEGHEHVVAHQTFSERLRGELGIRTPEFLSKKTNIPVERIEGFLTGRAWPSADELSNMANALSVSARWLSKESKYDESSTCVAGESLVKQWVDDTVEVEGNEYGLMSELIFHSQKFRNWTRKKGWLLAGPEDGKTIMAVRCNVGHHSKDHLPAILTILNDIKIDRVIFFASPVQPNGNYSQSCDGDEVNLPMVAALAEVNLPCIAPVYIVFDGRFLTAVRRPRYLDVRELLDAAISSEKSFFSQERAPFTSSLSAEEAAREMLKLGPLVQLTTATRAAYFELLSSIPESSFG